MIKTFITIVSFLITGPLFAVQFSAGLSSGVMQQPTSNYMHQVAGFDLGLATDNRSILVRFGYKQRPEYESASFTDGESHTYTWLGGGVKVVDNIKAIVAIGYGAIRGFIASSDGVERFYDLRGPLTSLEFSFFYRHFEVGVSHSLLVGLPEEEQFNAYVTWPYSFFALRFGGRI